MNRFKLGNISLQWVEMQRTNEYLYWYKYSWGCGWHEQFYAIPWLSSVEFRWYIQNNISYIIVINRENGWWAWSSWFSDHVHSIFFCCVICTNKLFPLLRCYHFYFFHLQPTPFSSFIFYPFSFTARVINYLCNIMQHILHFLRIYMLCLKMFLL